VFRSEIQKLNYHILTYGFFQIKIHKDKLYFWDTALIYEGFDTFEYCLEHHNTLKLNGLHVVTKADMIKEDILALIGYTYRYCEPSLDYIINKCFWDKKLGKKVNNRVNYIDYIKKDEVIEASI